MMMLQTVKFEDSPKAEQSISWEQSIFFNKKSQSFYTAKYDMTKNSLNF